MNIVRTDRQITFYQSLTCIPSVCDICENKKEFVINDWVV